MTTAPRIIVGSRTVTSNGVPIKRLREDDYVLDGFEASAFGDGLISVEKRPDTTKGTDGVLRGLAIRNGTVRNAGRVLAMPYDTAELEDFLVENITATDVDLFSRLRRARHGVFRNVHAVGAVPSRNGFPSGCMTSDEPTDDITYDHCSMHRFQQVPAEGKYWNGDGFADEERSTRMRYLDCEANDNADAGADLKSKDVQVIRFHAARNGRNVRLWGSGQVVDLVSRDPRKAHIWAGGETRLGVYVITRPQFIGGEGKPHLQVDAGSVASAITLVDPLDERGERIPRDQLRIVQNETGRNVRVTVVYTDSPVAPPPAPPEPEAPVEPEVPVEPDVPDVPVEPEVPVAPPVIDPSPQDPALALESMVRRVVRQELAPLASILASLAAKQP